MAWRGRRQLGQEAVFDVVATNGDPGVPSWPGSPPVLQVWRGTTLVLSDLKMPKVDPAAVGLFRRAVFLDDRFSAGHYEAVIRWTSGSYLGVRVEPFTVVAGGDAAGDVIALTHQELPQARFLVYQTTGGRLFRGKNPSY
jgi:hypothetical protein